jgi:hypothetical protein
MVSSNEAPGAGHVVHDYGRVTGKMSAQMARDRSGISIETTACGEANDNPDRLAVKSCLLSGDAIIATHEKQNYQKVLRPFHAPSPLEGRGVPYGCRASQL